jgi:hypothetical protein
MASDRMAQGRTAKYRMAQVRAARNPVNLIGASPSYGREQGEQHLGKQEVGGNDDDRGEDDGIDC